MSILPLLSVDPSIGRIEKDTLPQQTLMELFVKDCPFVQKIHGGKGTFPDISEWRGVLTDKTGFVHVIFWGNIQLTGSLAFEWLPPTLRQLHIIGCFLSGTLDLSLLSDSITTINLSVNAFTGEVTLEDLPQKITVFSVADNQLCGTLSLTQLPAALRELFLDHNQFVGSVCLTQLPSSLKYLSLSENSLCGSIDVTNLPSNINNLYLDANNFNGQTDFSNLPDALDHFSVANTNLSGDIHVHRSKHYAADRSKVTLHFFS